jgi:hypothetical protein
VAEITAREIVELLAYRHLFDVFVPECKTGATWGASRPLRLDAWACRASWQDGSIFGYEVKVSRADFVADRKWREYLPYCDRFYFVAPRTAVTAADLAGTPAGLVEVTAKHGLRVTRACELRGADPAALSSLLRYVVISRARIGPCWYGRLAERPPTVDEWRAWAADRKVIGRLARTRVAEVERRAAYLEFECAALRRRLDEVDPEARRG